MTGARPAAHRFFVEDERLAPEQCRQIALVLRLGPGEVVTLVQDGLELDYRLERVAPAEVTGTVVARRPAANEPRVALTLALPLLRGDRDEEVIEAVAQLGVTTIAPFTSARSVARGLSPAKRERWQRIAGEAAETSRRGRVPAVLEPREWPALLAALPRPVVIPWEEERERRLEPALGGAAALSLVIGPEGGLARDEIALARDRADAVTVTLGPRNLRSETAAVAAVARALAALEVS